MATEHSDDVIRMDVVGGGMNGEAGGYNEDTDPQEYEQLTLPEFDTEYLDDQDFRETGQADVTVKRIPFSELYNVNRENDATKRRYFLPGQKIHVTITDAFIPDNSRAINPYLYVIKLEHGEYEWTIHRRWKHFRHVHEQLMLFRAKVNLVRTREFEQRRKSFAARKQVLPSFPKRPDRLVEDMEERKKQLEDYLSNALRCPQYRNHPEMLKFLEVSRLSFVNQLGDKHREGNVNKRSGGGKTGGCFSMCKRCPCNGWKVRWLVLKDTFVAYMSPESNELRYVMLMDHDFKVRLLGTSVLNSICITNNTRELELFSWTDRKAQEWKEEIERVARSTGLEFIEPCRMKSFAPERQDIPCKWYVDAAGYMNDVADALESAREEIFITDWWLSPEVYLKRPFPECERWRLDLILQRKAVLGVKVFILLWKELPMAVGINSLYTKQALTRLHPDIRVLRDPDGFVNYWSHHEKMVCVDQKVAFLGGIDLCYGRWDTPLHRLTDLGSGSATTPSADSNLSNSFFLPEPELPMQQSAFYDQHEEHIEPENRTTQRQSSTGSRQSRHQQQFKRTVAQSLDEPDTRQRQNNNHSRANTVQDRMSRTRTGTTTTTTDSTEMQANGKNVYARSVSMPANFRDDHSVDNGWEEIGATVHSNDVILEEEENDDQEEHNESFSRLPLEDGVCNDSFEMEENPDAPNDKNIPLSSSLSDKPSPVSSSPASSGSLSLEDSTERTGTGTGTTGTGKFRKIPKMSGLVKSHMHQLVPKQNSVDSADGGEGGTTEDGGTKGEGGGALHLQSFASAVEEVMNRPEAFKEYLRGLSEEPPTMADEGDELVQQIRDNLNIKESVEPAGHPGSTVDPQLTDAAKAKFSRLHIQRVLKAQGSVDNLNPRPSAESQEKQQQEAHASPKQRSKLAQRARDLKSEMQHRYGLSRNSTDIRNKFSSNRSKSMDVDKMNAINMNPQILESILYKARDHPDIKLMTDQESKFWIGKDYTNFIFRDFVDLDKPFTDFIDRQETPRMPWHDISAVVYGKAARDVARHFIQRWNYTKKKKKHKDEAYPLLVPKTYSRVFVPPHVYTDPRTNLCDVQVLRSASAWSAGISKTECSIYNAYLDCIKNAQHYIYIENQFFISLEENILVSNHIAEALYTRIVQAHKAGEVFRVIVVLPLLPAFEGELGTTTGTSIQAVTHWNYASICRGANSLLGRLANAVNDPFKYISFYCLRNWGEIVGKLKTELVYVHSKLLIVDDRRVIIGSANINDRSLLGDRDSEIAVLVEDRVEDDEDTAVRSIMNGQPYMAGRFAYTLRTALFKEHLGASLSEVNDPISPQFYTELWMKQASINTDTFEKVFNCVPSDLARTFVQLKELQARPILANENPVLAKKKLAAVRGHLVLLPLHFLYEEKLQPAALTKEGMAPTFIWT